MNHNSVGHSSAEIKIHFILKKKINKQMFPGI